MDGNFILFKYVIIRIYLEVLFVYEILCLYLGVCYFLNFWVCYGINMNDYRIKEKKSFLYFIKDIRKGNVFIIFRLFIGFCRYLFELEFFKYY